MEEFGNCAVCYRSPMIGEEVTVVRGDRCEAAVCELCLDRPRAAELGEPLRRERVSSAAGAANVRGQRRSASPRRAGELVAA